MLQNGNYIEIDFSPNFPNLPLKEVIPQYSEQVKIVGRNKTMKTFRNCVREKIHACYNYISSANWKNAEFAIA